VTGSTFTGNNVEGGGGLYNNGGTTTVSDSTFTDNSAGIDGGGICSDAGVVIVNNTTFTGNSAFGNGGAVFVSSSGSGTAPGMTVTDSTFTDNCGFDGGGIFNDDGSTLVVTGSAFLNNSASNGTYGIGYGGGIFNFGTAAVSNSTFTSNAASNGGGIFNTLDYGGAGVLTITGSTFTNNSVTVNSNPVGPGGPCNGAGGGVCNEGIAMVTNP
jgi:predicted outer membrane repeat protein